MQESLDCIQPSSKLFMSDRRPLVAELISSL